jgi:hypothetical protein
MTNRTLSQDQILRIAGETDQAVGGYPGTAWLYEYTRRVLAAADGPCSNASRCRTAIRDRIEKNDRLHRLHKADRTPTPVFQGDSE